MINRPEKKAESRKTSINRRGKYPKKRRMERNRRNKVVNPHMRNRQTTIAERWHTGQGDTKPER